MQWDTQSVRSEWNNVKKPLKISPELWYFLDLASFFEPNIIALNENK